MKRKSQMRRAQLKRKAERGLRPSARRADQHISCAPVNMIVEAISGFARAAFGWVYR